MKSMTGYGRAAAALGEFTLTVQVSSVNRKTLDLTVRLPREWEGGLEAEVTAEVRRSVVRGKVHVEVELTGKERGSESAWSDEGVAQTLDRLRALAERRGIPFQVTTDLLWRIASDERQPLERPTAEAGRPVLLAALGEALAAFVAMRAREGAALQADLLNRLATLRSQVDAVAAQAPQVTGQFRELLFKRLREAGLELELADERVRKEVALFADRCDISEELTRLRSHLDQLDQLLRSGGRAAGKRSSFCRKSAGRATRSAARRTIWRSPRL